MKSTMIKYPISNLQKAINYVSGATFFSVFIYLGIFYKESPLGEVALGFAAIMSICYVIICFVSPYPEIYNIPIRTTDATRQGIYGVLVKFSTILRVYIAFLSWSVSINIIHYDKMLYIFLAFAFVGLILSFIFARKRIRSIRNGTSL